MRCVEHPVDEKQFVPVDQNVKGILGPFVRLNQRIFEQLSLKSD